MVRNKDNRFHFCVTIRDSAGEDSLRRQTGPSAGFKTQSLTIGLLGLHAAHQQRHHGKPAGPGSLQLHLLQRKCGNSMTVIAKV